MADSDLYEILGVPRSATDNELKQSYRRLAKEFHPDRNPEAGDKFKEISNAYETLSDPRKRSVYDRYGMKGVQDSSMNDGGGFHQDFFTSLFGGGLGANLFGTRHRRRMRADDTIQSVEVHLRDFYTGRDIKVPFIRKVFCNVCEGRGCKTGARRPCKACEGTGWGDDNGLKCRCSECGGVGDFMVEGDVCKMCDGRGTLKENASVMVHLEKGMMDTEKFYFRGEGDRFPDSAPGDVVILLTMIYDSDFIRQENNLMLERSIKLAEALCGFTIVIPHMDGRKLVVRQDPGEVIKPGSTKVIEGEGMPVKNSDEKGDLVVKFVVEFPTSGFANEEQLAQLKDLLPHGDPVEIPEGDDVEEVELQEYKVEKREGEGNGSDDEDDEDSGIQCPQQ